MCSRKFTCLIGVVFIFYQIFAAAQDVYIAELMVESNVTLETQMVMSTLNATSDLQVGDDNVTIVHNELVAECLIIGDETSCNCSKGFIWSNPVCYDYNCCNDTACNHNVSHITPLCIDKVRVHINGTVILDAPAWDDAKMTTLQTHFQRMNGLEYLNVTGQRSSNSIADFEAAVSARFETSKLQDVVSGLEVALGAVLWVDTLGMVDIDAPDTIVCYKSTPVLKCSFDQASDTSGWNLSTKYERFELNKGSVVELGNTCDSDEYKSCVTVTLNEVTGIWSGIYECGFTHGSVRHTAKAELSVALLPDKITLKINPLTADCSQGEAEVEVTATILNSTENFEVWWTYRGDKKRNYLTNTTDEEYLVYTFKTKLDCKKTSDAQYFTVTFENSRDQTKSARVDIPVIYEGAKVCEENLLDGVLWPKTPAGDTVINRTCAEGRVGYLSRTCEDSGNWKEVFSYCVSEELNKVVDAADNFLKGLGATQEVAMDIFQGLKNSSTVESDPSDSIADIGASVNILNVMANASQNIVLQEDVLPDFVNAASNMLNKTWDGVNKSTVENMSSIYLQSVEGLVKNININNSKGLNTANLDLKFCSSGDCNVSVFDIGVNLNKTDGTMKTVGVKSLTDKLRNNFRNSVPTPYLISATLTNTNNSGLEIRMEFPQDQLHPTTPYCVFWNPKENDWSDEGCVVKSKDANHTVCECSHLTAFSVLMAKTDISTDALDIITNVGLGVSVCCLLIFIAIEALVWSAVVKSNLSHFRHTALVNIAVFLLLADCSFLASTHPEALTDNWCLVLTVCKHLFFLAMFSWMLCMSVMLVHQLIFVFSPLRKRVFMFLSSIAGYVSPILIVGTSYIYCKYTEKPYYDKKTCWLVYERLLEGSMHAFVLPVGTVILTNLFSMVVVIVTLVKSSVPDSSKGEEKDTVKSILKVVVFLTPVFGVTWIIGFALLLLEPGPIQTIANYSFTILNSFQGLLILITGVFAEQKVREEVLKLIMAKGKGKSESMKNLTSTTYTKDK